MLGDPQGELALAIARNSELTIFVQSPRDEEVAAARKAADAAGLLGTRVYVQKGDCHAHQPGRRPGRCGDRDQAAPPACRARSCCASCGPKGRRCWPMARRLTKPYAAGTDEWTHPYHGPDNNPQSLDQVVRRPYLTHFMAEPWYCPLSQMTVDLRRPDVQGRSAIAPRPGRRSSTSTSCWRMSAFNGTILWKRPLTRGFMIHRNTFIATPETLYLADDKSCQLIDAATGKVRDEIVVPEGLADGPVWKWMALEDGVLYALVGEKELPDEPLRGDRIRGAGWPWWKINKYAFGFGRTLLAIDATDAEGPLAPSRRASRSTAGPLCLKNGRLYFYSDGKFLACLDAKTGDEVWRNSDEDLLEAIGTAGPAQNPMLGFASTAYMKCGDDALFFAGPQRPRIVAASTRGRQAALAARRRQRAARAAARWTLRPRRRAHQSATSSVKLDPLTGEVLAEFPSRDRCTRATGCVDSIFTRGGAGGSTAVFDVTSKQPKLGVVSPMRPACTDGVVVAHGYLFWGPWMCRCDMTQLGVISLGPGGTFDYTAEATDAERLETAAERRTTSRRCRSTRRRLADVPQGQRPQRGDQSHARPPTVDKRWEFKPPQPIIPTAPVAAAGLVFVSGADGIVRALDAQTGKPRWTAYTAAGRSSIRRPSAKDRAYVGGGDGWVYCLEAATGRLLWRFRAAPQERMMPVYGSLTSTWPVGSGVLVDHGVVYAAAGISNFDGTHVYALDALTRQDPLAESHLGRHRRRLARRGRQRAGAPAAAPGRDLHGRRQPDHGARAARRARADERGHVHRHAQSAHGRLVRDRRRQVRRSRHRPRQGPVRPPGASAGRRLSTLLAAGRRSLPQPDGIGDARGRDCRGHQQRQPTSGQRRRPHKSRRPSGPTRRSTKSPPWP